MITAGVRYLPRFHHHKGGASEREQKGHAHPSVVGGSGSPWLRKPSWRMQRSSTRCPAFPVILTTHKITHPGLVWLAFTRVLTMHQKTRKTRGHTDMDKQNNAAAVPLAMRRNASANTRNMVTQIVLAPRPCISTSHFSPPPSRATR